MAGWGGRILALAGASVLLASRGDNAGISNYVKLRSAVTCGCPRLMLNVQLAARFAPVMHRILHSYAWKRARPPLAVLSPARHAMC